MSLLNKKWEISNTHDYLTFQEKIYKNRGLDSIPHMEAFLYPSLEKNLHDPYKMKGMHKAVSRIKQAIKAHERIVIFGDYDADGVTSTFLLYSFLKKIGAQVSYRIPHRIENGYGLKKYFIDEIASKSVSLIITVDCGMANLAEVDYALEKGIETIITDHHTPQLKLPQATAILNPKQLDCEYPFKELAGVGVTYKLITALTYEFLSGNKAKEYLKNILDIVAIGTVADCMPIIEENRTIVKYGLEILTQTQNKGLKALMQQAKINPKRINTETIGFTIGPRINVAGRLKHAYHALDLLLGKTEMAEILDVWNQNRKEVVEDFMEELEPELQNQPADKPYFLFKNKKWHAGIVGLIAGRLTEKYSYPSIIMEEREDKLIASCRSIEAINIFKVLEQAKDLFEHFGGHAQAAGFSLEPQKYLEFEDRIDFILKREAKKIDFRPILKIDCEVQPTDISWKNLEIIEKLAPFGIGNEKPTFLLKNIKPHAVHTTGKKNNHIKFSIETPLGKIKVIGFNQGFMQKDLMEHKPIDLVFRLERNEWKGKQYIQLRLVDLKTL